MGGIESGASAFRISSTASPALKGIQREWTWQPFAVISELSKPLSAYSFSSEKQPTGIPDHVKAQFPNVPWRDIRDMGNLVVHRYWGVDADRLWDTVKNDLPLLAIALRNVLEQARDAEAQP